MKWIRRLMNLFRSGRLDAEIDEELRFHIEARINGNIAAGMSEEEARRDAARRFGGRLQARERSRDADIVVWIETLAQDTRYAIRGLRKNPGVTAVAIISLGLAIGANTAIFSVVDAVLLRSLPYRDSERIVMLWTSNALNGATEQNTSVPNMEDWKARSHTLEDIAAYRYSDGPLIGKEAAAGAEWIDYAFVTGNFFNLLGRAPILGRVFGEDEVAGFGRVAVLSSRLWQRRFHGSPDVIGQVLNIGGAEVEVIGVMPDDFRFPTKDIQLWVPASVLPLWQKSRVDRGTRFGTVFGRLRPGATFDQARTELRSIAADLERQYPAPNQNLGSVNVVPLQVQVNGKSVPFMLAILFGAVMLVLMIACANVANLLLARGAAREREIALRAALGAGRARIVRQLLTESVLLACAAGCLGLLLASWSLRALIALAPRSIVRLDEVHLDGTVLLFTLLLSLAAGILFGLAPAVRISRPGPSRNSAAGHSTRFLRGAFVVYQFALAVVLLAGAGLLIRSLLAIQSVDPGFGSRSVLTAHLRFHNALPRLRRIALYKDAMERLSRLSGVRAVGAIGQMFWTNGGGKFGLRAVEGRPPERREQWSAMTWTTISGDYFQALGVPLLRGRFFSEQDRADSPPVVLINETMARRYWPGADPGDEAVGKRIKGFDARGRNDEWVTVVGVVKDVRSRGLERTPMAQIFETQSQSLDETENLVVSGGRAEGLAAAMRSTIREIDRTAVLSDVSTIEQRLDEQTAQRRFQTDLLGVFAALALALAGAGIFGMMHHSVAQRMQEIGIRMALGAPRGMVLVMVLREGLALAAIGVALGAVGSLVLLRPITSLLYGVTPSDPMTFASVSLALTAIALAGCYVPARRATKVDPIVVLRTE